MSLNKPSETDIAVWEVAKKLQEFRPSDLIKYGVQLSTAQTFIKFWVGRGWARVRRKDDSNNVFYCSVEMFDAEIKPVSGEASAEGNMWRVMRRLPTFTPIDIATHANAGGVEVTVQKARSYCQRLLGAGYLRVRVQAVPGRREAAYTLIENTGPRAPTPARIQGLLDPNTSEFFPADTRVKS